MHRPTLPDHNAFGRFPNCGRSPSLGSLALATFADSCPARPGSCSRSPPSKCRSPKHCLPKAGQPK
eukprot:5931672-Alexandrium_andersonii.AAC.1